MIDIDKIKKDIVQKLQPIEAKKIILFGSYAYGTPNEDSDLDIIIIKKSYKNKWEELKEIRDYLKDIKIAKDILLTTTDYFQSHISEEWINSAWYDANRYGEVLYEKK